MQESDIFPVEPEVKRIQVGLAGTSAARRSRTRSAQKMLYLLMYLLSCDVSTICNPIYVV